MTIAQESSTPAAAAAPDSDKRSWSPSHSWLHTILIDGPDPQGMKESFWDTLLNWPARLLLVLGLALVGEIWARYPLGVQLGWGLNYGLLAGISVVASVWFYFLFANLVLAGLWLLASYRRPLRVQAASPSASEDPDQRTWDLSDSITWLNRQAGHVEALAVWTALAFVVCHELTWQLAAFSSLLLLAEPCLNGLARWELRRNGQKAPMQAAVMMARRKWIYAATFLGFIALSLLAWRQTLTLLPLFLTVVPGIGLRLWRARLRKRQEKGELAHRQTRLALAERQRRAAPVADALFGPGLALVVTALLCVGSFMQQKHLRAAAEKGEKTPTANVCVRDAAGPETPTLAVMLLADSQTHTLGGVRFPGQLELADTVVPVALRPVELDMLSGAAVTRVAQIYEQRKAERKKIGQAPPLWAHLGDFADLACVDEMTRTLDLLKKSLGTGPALAGLALGNHDSSFVGNFAWSPFWDTACDPTAGEGTSPGRMNKGRADALVADLLPSSAPARGSHAGTAPISVSKAIGGWTWHWPFHQKALARITVTHLGVLPGLDAAGVGPRGVVAVFLDSSDRGENDFGVPGEHGALSAKQAREVQPAIQSLKQAEREQSPWADPWFVLFMHHPYDALTKASQRNLDELVKGLNGGNPRAAARVLALISAHTHTAKSFWHDVGSHKLREIVIGSVIDPPQQAAWLELGLDTRGQAALRVSSLPTVARAGRMCATDHAVDAGVCQRAMARLAAAPECRSLLTDDTAEASCEKLERTLSTKERLNALAVAASNDDPKTIRQKQDKRAQVLLQCVTRGLPRGSASLPNAIATQTCPQHALKPGLLEDPLANDAYAPLIAELAADDCRSSPNEPSHHQELACLAWAASAVQEHKASGMTMASAIRCSFDDPSLPAAQVCVATEVR